MYRMSFGRKKTNTDLTRKAQYTSYILTLSCACVCVSARYLWSEAGGDGAVREALWEQAGPHAGGAVCGLYTQVGPTGRRPVQATRAGQLGQRAAGCL